MFLLKGTVQMPDTLPDDTYDIDIHAGDSQLRPLVFKMVVIGNRRPPTDNHFVGRVTTNPNTMEFVLRWDVVPQDLDSHMYASNGTHVFFHTKTAGTMSLDCDVMNGNGPETIKVTLEPSVKYVYAVHR